MPGRHAGGWPPKVRRVERAIVYVGGDVQGVGFRFWVRQQARRIGLVGYATNLDDGRVEVVAQGGRDAVDRLLRLIEESPSTAHRPGSVRDVETRWSEAASELTTFDAR
jgi:acylphosphatase